jgi:hypothetical protein
MSRKSKSPKAIKVKPGDADHIISYLSQRLHLLVISQRFVLSCREQYKLNDGLSEKQWAALRRIVADLQDLCRENAALDPASVDLTNRSTNEQHYN